MKKPIPTHAACITHPTQAFHINSHLQTYHTKSSLLFFSVWGYSVSTFFKKASHIALNSSCRHKCQNQIVTTQIKM